MSISINRFQFASFLFSQKTTIYNNRFNGLVAEVPLSTDQHTIEEHLRLAELRKTMDVIYKDASKTIKQLEEAIEGYRAYREELIKKAKQQLQNNSQK